jgi:hypothetical protein
MPMVQAKSLLPCKSKKNYIFLVCVCSLRSRSSEACPAVPFSSPPPPQLSHKQNNFCNNKKIEHQTCISIFWANFVWNISRSKRNSARYVHKST